MDIGKIMENKKLLALAGLLCLLALVVVGGSYYLRAKHLREATLTAARQAEQAAAELNRQAEQAEESVQNIADAVSQSASQGVLPDISAAKVNPLEDMPDANPYRDANPFSDVKTNPFR